jgi:hypothetical protein
MNPSVLFGISSVEIPCTILVHDTSDLASPIVGRLPREPLKYTTDPFDIVDPVAFRTLIKDSCPICIVISPPFIPRLSVPSVGFHCSTHSVGVTATGVVSKAIEFTLDISFPFRLRSPVIGTDPSAKKSPQEVHPTIMFLTSILVDIVFSI